MNIITSNKNQNKAEINVLEIELESLSFHMRYLIAPRATWDVPEYLQAGPTKARISFNDTYELNNFINALTELRNKAVANAEWTRWGMNKEDK